MVDSDGIEAISEGMQRLVQKLIDLRLDSVVVRIS